MTRHLLRLRVLDVANADQRKQAIQMPLLAFERNVECHHPVVDKL